METLPNTTDWYGRFRAVANAGNDYLIDRELQKTASYTGIGSIHLQDQAVTESMGEIYDRTQEHLGTTDAMVIFVRRQLINAAKALREQGVDVEFENWRSLVAPPGISPADRARLESAVRAMVQSPTWRESLRRYRWLDRHLDGDAFARFVDAEEARVRAILKKLGTGDLVSTSFIPSGAYPRLVLSGLLVFGLGVLIRRRRDRAGRSDAFPTFDAAPVTLVAAGGVLHLLLAERAGFVIAATVLFWCTARAFDHRHPVRDLVAALAISLASYVLFARVLQLSLP